ncbi:hypothetical protein [Rubellimicrobium roseum]|uniref:Uncharacterized protein n=1 Tax=Rubellimicrobium roseum TaxID=687525 RepID=A0A5C4NDV1_9RHOB|nr:hypothetical protein [Rubellimicrobium roseum]TNC72974.1 hypothetical protein FHG71_06650 [Rubellimicrobium roseum]
MRHAARHLTACLRDEDGAVSMPWLYAGLLVLALGAIAGETDHSWERVGYGNLGPLSFWLP